MESVIVTDGSVLESVDWDRAECMNRGVCGMENKKIPRWFRRKLTGWRPIGPPVGITDAAGMTGCRRSYYLERPNFVRFVYVDRMKNGEVRIIDDKENSHGITGFENLAKQQVKDQNDNGAIAFSIDDDKQIPLSGPSSIIESADVARGDPDKMAKGIDRLQI